MIGVMSKKKADSKRSQGIDRHTTPRVVFHMPQDLFDAFQEYMSSLEPASTDSAVMRLALQRYLESKGYWPRAKGGSK
jgi:hypothetical protein